MFFKRRLVLLFVFLPLLYLVTFCGGGGKGGVDPSISNCNALAESGCGDGLVCEFTLSGGADCFTPILLRGRVFDLADDFPVEGARVVARDVNGAVASSVAVTDADGNYELEVSVTRDNDGNPTSSQSVTLRADAAGYQTFPGGVRQALSIDVANTTEENESLIVENVQTDIGLIALEAGAGTALIFGKVNLPEDVKGALVVAELLPTKGFTAIADREGNYKIFNLLAGAYTITAYVQGGSYNTASATLADGNEVELNFNVNDQSPASLLGRVQIVNPGLGDATSIILVVESTFDENLVLGEMPPGLRAPESGLSPDVKGEFTIEGIPVGRYVILAAFENDYLVRDPNTCISGTDIIHQTFGAGETIDLSSQGFKITGSLNVISPGASGPETVSTTTPVFTWEDDSSEDNYDLVVFDSFGNKVWETSIPGVSGGSPSVTYNADGTGAGTATTLKSGMYYQFRVTSTAKNCELSQTEDMKGVFFVE
jgi:hypothetical protein